MAVASLGARRRAFAPSKPSDTPGPFAFLLDTRTYVRYDGDMAVRPDPVVEQTLDRVGTLCAQRHALDIELCEQLAVLADAGNPQAAGFRSVAQWLALAGGLSGAEAQRYVRVSRELSALGELVSDAREGRVGIVALDSVAKVITTDNADKLTCLTRTLGVAALAKALGLYRRYSNVARQWHGTTLRCVAPV